MELLQRFRMRGESGQACLADFGVVWLREGAACGHSSRGCAGSLLNLLRNRICAGDGRVVNWERGRGPPLWAP